MKYLFLFLSIFTLNFCENKIVCFFTSPRALSTVTFRMFENRDDFVPIHEPFLPIFCREAFPPEIIDYYRDDSFVNYSQILDCIDEAKEKGHVVIKDMSYAGDGFIEAHPEFAKDENNHFFFMVRHPYWIIQSILKELPDVDETLDILVGVKQTYNLFQKVKELSPNNVSVVLVDELLADPEGEIRKLFDDFAIEFSEKSLSWPSLGEDFDGSCWHEQKKYEPFQKWHKKALNSTHLVPRKMAKDVPSVSEVFTDLPLNRRVQILKIYFRHLMYYRYLCEER